jgi:hypothetical protein
MEIAHWNTGQIALVEACTAFVRARFPDWEIIDLDPGSSPDGESFKPVISVALKGEPDPQNHHLKLRPEFWLGISGSNPCITYAGEVIDMERTGNSAFAFIFAGRWCPECGSANINFATSAPLSDAQMRCLDCNHEGLVSDFSL